MDILPQSELISIQTQLIGAEKQNAVNARELHTTLEVKKDFHTWLKAQISSLSLEENSDYRVFPLKGENSSPQGGRPKIDYIFTLDVAKHIAMASRTAKGREVRNYFIEIEKAFKRELIDRPFVDVLKMELNQIELDTPEDAEESENALLKRYIRALEDNGTYIQKFVIDLIQNTSKANNLVTYSEYNEEEYISKMLKFFDEWIGKNKENFSFTYEGRRSYEEDTCNPCILSFGNINSVKETIEVKADELHRFCERNNFSMVAFLKIFSDRGLLLEDNQYYRQVYKFNIYPASIKGYKPDNAR